MTAPSRPKLHARLAFLGLGLLIISWSWSWARADEPAPAPARPTAAQAADHMLEHDVFGRSGAQVKARMILVDKDGHRDERTFESLSARKGATTRSLVRFRAPERVAGTAILVIEDDSGAQQYIYLPAYKKTRRIAARERSESFLGSDFTYADLERRYVREARQVLLTDEAIDGKPCYVLESTPKEGASPYGRVVTWLRQSDFVPLRVQFFAPGGKQLVKTIFTKRIRTIDGKPVVVETHTETAANGHATDLVLDEVTFVADVPDSELNPAALERP